MERKEKTTVARFKRGRAGAKEAGSTSLTAEDLRDIGSLDNEQAWPRHEFQRRDCCNALTLLHSLRKHKLLRVTSQVHLKHYNETAA
jgi:hypothetical protein